MTYHQLWLHYLRAHQQPGTRMLHYLGSLLALLLLAASAIRLDWHLLVAAVVTGYGCAWLGHIAVERNRPATFGHPAWSLVSDYRMLALWLTGRLDRHLDQANSVTYTPSP